MKRNKLSPKWHLDPRAQAIFEAIGVEDGLVFIEKHGGLDQMVKDGLLTKRSAAPPTAAPEDCR